VSLTTTHFSHFFIVFVVFIVTAVKTSNVTSKPTTYRCMGHGKRKKAADPEWVFHWEDCHEI
jgi:hypothetical protein